MKVAAIFAMLLAQLGSCTRSICPPAIDAEPTRTGLRQSAIQDVVPLRAGDHLVTTITHPTAMTVTRIRDGREESVASTPPLFPYTIRPSIVAGENGWWFSRYGRVRTRASIFFARGGDTVVESRVDVPVRGESSIWLPLPGNDPRGVLVSRAQGTPTLQFDEVTPAGLQPLGEMPWPATGTEQTFFDSRWSAEVLRDGRIAVVTVEGHDDTGTIRVYTLGQENAVAVLPCDIAIDHAVDTAVDASGALAIVGLTGSGKIVTTLARVDDLQSARCRVIGLQDEVAMTPPFGAPNVEATADGFVAAWIRSDGTIRATVLRDRKAAPLIVDIGRASTSALPLTRLLHRVGDHVVFVWRAEGDEVLERWIEGDVVGHAIALDLLRALCAPR